MTQPNKTQPTDKWQKMAEESDKPNTEDGDDTLNPESVEKTLDFPTRQALEDQLTAYERKTDEYKQQALRAQAELENYRRRAERDVASAHKFGVEQLIITLLPVVDSLTRGLESCDTQDAKVKAIREGMQLTLDILNKALVKFGVEMIEPAVGEPFDPKLHEAMGMQHDPNVKPNTILKLLQKGYQLHGRVLRAAMVMVAQ